MTFTINKDYFLEKIDHASRFTAGRLVSTPVLQGVYLVGEKGIIDIFASNLNTYYQTSLKTDFSGKFQIVVEPRKLVEFLQFLTPGKIEVEVEERQISIQQGKTKGNFPLIQSNDFPIPPKIKIKAEKIDARFFEESLPLVLFTASTDDSRPALTGVNFVSREDDLLLVATDGFRLSLVREKNKINLPSMIVPADFLAEIVRNIKNQKELIFSFSREEKIVSFQIKDNLFYSRLIDGEFPPFEKVIPAESRTTIKLDREELSRNIKLISIFARDFSNVVVCEFSSNELILRPKKEGNEENLTKQEIEFTGDNQKVAFNYKYLLDLLTHVDAKQLQIDLLRSDAPVIFRIPGNESFLHIIMPVRIQEE